MKYLKYFISPATIVFALFAISKGAYYPTAFLIGFSFFIILGDFLIKEDYTKKTYKHPFFLNLPIYLNLPLTFKNVGEIIAYRCVVGDENNTLHIPPPIQPIICVELLNSFIFSTVVNDSANISLYPLSER